MDEALFHLLHSSERVFARVANQIFWGVAPQDASLPYVVLNLISGTNGLTLEGPEDLWQGRVQIDCYGAKRPAARDLSRAVEDLLNGYQGGGFQGVFLDSSREDFEEAALGRPSRITHDFNINWSAENG